MTPASTPPADDGSSDVVDTAMGTGSDSGAPGEHRPGPPLDASETALLDSLQRDDDGEPVAAVVDSPAMTAAAEDDAVLPAASGSAGVAPGPAVSDAAAETPQFVEPDGS